MYLKSYGGLLNREIQSEKTLHFVDFGAGEGFFGETLAKNSPQHNVTIISYKQSRKLEETRNLKIFKDRLFEQIPSEELLKQFGKFDVVIDHWGILAYSSDPGQTLLQLKNLCAQDGRILLMTDTRSKYKKTTSLYNSRVRMKNGERVTLPDWIKAQSGLIVKDYNFDGIFIIQFDPNTEFNPEKLETVYSIKSAVVPNKFGGSEEEPRAPAARMFLEK